MGNSHGVHDDHQHQHYHPHHQHSNQQQPPSWVQSMPRDMYHHRQSTGVGGGYKPQQVKVLPELNGGPRLRPTNNGQILQSGGTISIKNQGGVQRSRSVSAPHHYATQSQSPPPMTTFQPQFLKVRSQTQVQMMSRQSPSRDGLSNSSKKFGSESDIKEKLAAEAALNQKGAQKQKGGNLKKRRAPDVPNNNKNTPEQIQEYRPTNGGPSRNEGVNRKLRLFKSKVEAAKKSQPVDTVDHRARPSQFTKRNEIHEARSSPHTRAPAPTGMATKQGGVVAAKLSSQNSDWKKSVPKLPGLPIFRREKSFDITLMSEMNRQRELVQQKPRQAQSPPMQRKSQTHANKMEERKLPKIPTPPKLHDRKHESKQTSATKSYVRKQIQPLPTHKNDFQQELLQATKRRSVALAETDSLKTASTLTADEKARSSSKSPEKSDTGLSSKSKTPSPEKIIINVSENTAPRRSVEPIAPAQLPLGQSSVPKTFYFGGLDSVEKQTEEDVDQEQMELIDRFAESFLIQRKYAVSSESALSTDTEDNLELRNSQDTDNEISLQLRPILPRKQFDIPRFSPAAAWRQLATEDEKRSDTMDWLNAVEKVNLLPIETRQESERSEERIERIYREPVPGVQTDNKSGDSGISGDAGLPERTESPSRHHNTQQRKADREYLGTWTPQQDLGEESSTDDDTEESIKHQLTTYHHKQVFNLTLPRDVHTPTYSDKSDKNVFNSLQRMRKSQLSAVAAVAPLDEEIDVADNSLPIINDDNWFLSRSNANGVITSVIDVRRSNEGSYRGGSISNGDSNRLHHFNSLEDDIKPIDSHETISYLASGKHKVYLPNNSSISSGKEGCSLPIIPITNYGDELTVTKLISKIPVREKDRETPAALDGVGHRDDKGQSLQTLPIKLSNKKGKFTYQSTVRQVERRRISEILSREAEEMEAQRLSELEVMKRVEEEFQRKRAKEKDDLRNQLQIFTNDDNQYSYSLPVEWDPDTKRCEPEGASPVPEHSPTAGVRGSNNFRKSSPKSDLHREDSDDTFVDTKTPYISRLVEQKSGRHESKDSKPLVEIQPYQPRSYISVDRQQRHQSPSSKQYNLSSPSGNYSSTQQQQMSLSLAYTGGGRSNGISNTDMQPDVSDLHQSLLMTNSITRVYQSMGGGGNGGSSYDKVFQ